MTERKEKRSKRKEQGQGGKDDENSENGGNGNHVEDDFGEDDDAEWTTDVSKEAVKKRMKVKTVGINKAEALNIFNVFFNTFFILTYIPK